MVRVTIRGKESEVYTVLDRMAQVFTFGDDTCDVISDYTLREVKAVFYVDGMYRRIFPKKRSVGVRMRDIGR